MRVLVVYASAYGATKGIAERIANTIRGEQLEVDLHPADDPIRLDAATYDAFVIGSAVHAGHWLKSATRFVQAHEQVLKEAPVWLFSSGPIGDKSIGEPQPDPRDIDDIRDVLNVRDHVVFGGAFDPTTADLERVGWIERQFSTHFLPVGDWRNWEDIENWSRQIAAAVKSAKEPVPIG
jgi:menaquinone-dependent protoporphyrinogen oxidase